MNGQSPTMAAGESSNISKDCLVFATNTLLFSQAVLPEPFSLWTYPQASRAVAGRKQPLGISAAQKSPTKASLELQNTHLLSVEPWQES